jgi:hypothetical protein
LGETVERRSFGDFGRLTYWPRRRPDIASRVQELADPTAILATKSIVNAAEAAGLVGAGGYRTSSRQLHDERPDLFKLSREAHRTRLTASNTEPTDAAVAARHFAMQVIHKHAEAIRGADPGLTIQAARIEARRRFPEIAARERSQ